MRAFALSLFVSLALGAAALATEPGAPMDCSDLELAPGLTCTDLSAPGRGFLPGGFGVVDNEGRLLDFASTSFVVVGSCGGSELRRTPLIAAADGSGASEALVTVTWRCFDATKSWRETVHFSNHLFDPVSGRLFVQALSGCGSPAFGKCYDDRPWVARIDGFTPLADVLPPPPLPEPLCSNGQDDDGDGRIDGADAHCKSDADNDESRP